VEQVKQIRSLSTLVWAVSCITWMWDVDTECCGQPKNTRFWDDGISTVVKGEFRAGLTIVPVVPWERPRPPGGPDQLQIFYHALSLDVTTTKKDVNFFGEEKCTSEKNPGTSYEKRAPALRCYGPLRMVNPALGKLDSTSDDRISTTRSTATRTSADNCT